MKAKLEAIANITVIVVTLADRNVKRWWAGPIHAPRSQSHKGR
jgi:hypothetical protein